MGSGERLVLSNFVHREPASTFTQIFYINALIMYALQLGIIELIRSKSDY